MSAAVEPKDTEPAGRVRSRSLAADLLERYALLLVWGVVVVVFGILRPDTFLTTSNFSTIFGSQAILVVLTLALLPPLTAGDYDLSVAATLTLSSMTLAILNVNHGWSIGAAIAAALAVGLLIGIINGALVVLLGIDSLIVTLGTSTFIAGVVLWISNSLTISGVSQSLIDVVVVNRFLGVPLAFYYGIAVGLVMFYVFEYMPIGRRLLFVGRGRSVARRRPLRRHPGLRGSHVGPELPAAGVRGGLPRRDDDHARPLQPARLDRRRLLPRHGDHRAAAARRADVRAAALLRRRARARGRPLPTGTQARCRGGGLTGACRIDNDLQKGVKRCGSSSSTRIRRRR
jgi:hypothetical protein